MSFRSGASYAVAPNELPSYRGFKAWTGAPEYTSSAGTAATQQVNCIQVYCPNGFTAANIYYLAQTAGSSLTAASATTVAAGSDGAAVTAGTLNVAANAGFSAVNPSYLRVVTNLGTSIVKYTGTGVNTFTGCTTVSGTGIVNTGNVVGQSYNTAALYSSNGTTLTQIGFALDQFSTWTSAGLKTGALTVVEGQSLAIGAGQYYYLMDLSTGTTPITWRGYTGNAASVGAGLTAAFLRWGRAVATGAANTLPDQFTLASLSTASVLVGWAAIA